MIKRLFFLLFVALLWPTLTVKAHAQTWSSWTPIGSGLYWRIQKIGEWKSTFTGFRTEYWNWQFRKSTDESVDFDYGVDTAPGPVIDRWYAQLPARESSQVLGDFFPPTATLYIDWRVPSILGPQPVFRKPVNRQATKDVPSENIPIANSPTNTNSGIPPSTPTTIPISQPQHSRPCVSPNGKKVAFLIVKSPTLSEFCVANINGTGFVSLGEFSGSIQTFCFSPDSKRITFIRTKPAVPPSQFRSSDSEISVVNVDGSGLKTISASTVGGNDSLNFSPDGSKIAFSSSRDGNNEIYVINSDGTGEKRLTNNTESDIYPIFISDNSIAYMVILEGHIQIKKIDVEGNEPQTIDDHLPAPQPMGIPIENQPLARILGTRYTPMVLSPDGSKIVYLWYNGRNTELSILGVDGGLIKRLVQQDTTLQAAPPMSNGMFNPNIRVPIRANLQFSPDGTRILYVSRHDGNEEIYILGSDGTQLQRLTVSTAIDSSPMYNSDGSKVLFLSSLSENPLAGTKICIMNSDGSDPEPLTTERFPNTEIAFAESGHKIVFISSRIGSKQLHLMNADGSEIRPLLLPSGTTSPPKSADPTFVANPASIRDAVFSPDGSKIAYVSVEGTNADIYLMNADGTGPQRLTRHTGENKGPVFSPDGTKIAFYSTRESGMEVSKNSEIYVMNVDGSDQTQLTNDRFASSITPAFSPDGSKIAYVTSNVGGTEIYVMKADGSERKRLTSNPGPDVAPAFSPDGTKIAFVSYREGKTNIYLMNADGTGQTRLTNDDYTKTSPLFSPDGSKIAYSVKLGSSNAIAIISVGGGTSRVISDTNLHARFPTFSEDGRRVAYIDSVNEVARICVSKAVISNNTEGTVTPIALSVSVLPTGLLGGVPNQPPLMINQTPYGLRLDKSGASWIFLALNNQLKVLRYPPTENLQGIPTIR